MGAGIGQIQTCGITCPRSRVRLSWLPVQSRGYVVTNDHFCEKSWYFRNALVRSNYENSRRNIEKPLLPLEEFFKVLLFGDEIELKNRLLRIGAEHGSSVVTAVSGLHRRNKNPDVGAKRGDDVQDRRLQK